MYFSLPLSLFFIPFPPICAKTMVFAQTALTGFNRLTQQRAVPKLRHFGFAFWIFIKTAFPFILKNLC